MSELCQLVFYGEVLPGHAVHDAREKLAALLKLQLPQLDAVFSGRRVVLRKSLPTEQAASYVARLESMGLRVFAEPIAIDSPSPLPSAQLPDRAHERVPEAAPTTPSARASDSVAAAAADPAGAASAAEEMDCPKCGERQPRRTLCRACSVDMRRFAEAQEESAREAAEQRLLDREIALASRGRGRPSRSDQDALDSRLLGFDFDGRLGRLAYLLGNLLCWAILCVALLVFAKLGSVAAALALAAIACILSFRLAFLRFHDFNRSGWFSLLFLIPYLGGLLGLVLLFIPGSRDDNDYGAPVSMPGLPTSAAMFLFCAVATGLLFSQQDVLMQQYATQYFAHAGSRQAGTYGRGAQERAPLSVAEADVEIFTTTECGVCHAAKAYMDARGISYAEKNVEENEDYLREFYARGGRGVPYIFVGDESMSGFDPERLERMLGNRS